eukprot:NODE_812_length_3739_cov_0.536813.p3 type:complete len:265 gc:universal NODE_812_length_3739_cov_0.536813:353-1147(+)
MGLKGMPKIWVKFKNSVIENSRSSKTIYNEAGDFVVGVIAGKNFAKPDTNIMVHKKELETAKLFVASIIKTMEKQGCVCGFCRTSHPLKTFDNLEIQKYIVKIWKYLHEKCLIEMKSKNADENSTETKDHDELEMKIFTQLQNTAWTRLKDLYPYCKKHSSIVAAKNDINEDNDDYGCLGCGEKCNFSNKKKSLCKLCHALDLKEAGSSKNALYLNHIKMAGISDEEVELHKIKVEQYHKAPANLHAGGYSDESDGYESRSSDD